MGPLLWSAPLLGLKREFGFALVYASHVFLVTCAWLARAFASHVGGRGPVSNFLFLGVESLLASMGATSFLSLAPGWRRLLRATWVGGARFQLFFLGVESFLASMGATLFLSHAPGWRRLFL